MIDKIYFFNDYGAGDVHYSREFVKDIMSKVPARIYEYEVKQNLMILKDIDNLFMKKISVPFRIRYVNNRIEINYFEDDKTFNIKVKNFNNEIIYNINFLLSQNYTTWLGVTISEDFIIEIYENDFLRHKELYKYSEYNIETWVGYKDYFKKYNCTLYSNYEMFTEYFEKLNIPIEKIDYYLPSINFDKLKTENIDNFVKNDNKKVLISNGDVLSLQANNFDFDPIVERLANSFPDVIFFMTHQPKFHKDNVISISDITNTETDLNEIGYISTFCDIVVGRSSGPYCFTHIKDNFFRDMKFIAICDDPDTGIYYYGKKYHFQDAKDITCKYVHSSNYDVNSIYETIKSNIK
jgi:hypothetical protein